MEVALLLVGYAIGLSVWASLAVWFLRRVIVAGRWSVGAVRTRAAVVPASQMADVVPLPTRLAARAAVPQVASAMTADRRTAA